MVYWVGWLRCGELDGAGHLVCDLLVNKDQLLRDHLYFREW